MFCIVHEQVSQTFQMSCPPFLVYFNSTLQIGPSCLLFLDTILLLLQSNILYLTSQLISPDLKLFMHGIQLLVYKKFQSFAFLQSSVCIPPHEFCYSCSVYLHIGPPLMTSREVGATLGHLCNTGKASSTWVEWVKIKVLSRPTHSRKGKGYKDTWLLTC